MKKIIIALTLIIAIFVMSCIPAEDVTNSDVSKCASYSSDSARKLCLAEETEDITICGQINDGLTKEECVILLAEIVQDPGMVEHCTISKVDSNIVTCQALFHQDVQKCFEIKPVSGGDLRARDCIELTARKAQNKEFCNVFDTERERMKGMCEEYGSKSDCERWDYYEEYVEDCKSVVDNI